LLVVVHRGGRNRFGGEVGVVVVDVGCQVAERTPSLSLGGGDGWIRNSDNAALSRAS
jgi:hypothetical protein